jgi:hypothetical protein
LRVTSQAFSKGDEVLSVPLDVCIVRQLDAQDAMAAPEAAGEGAALAGQVSIQATAGQIDLTQAQRKSMLWVVELFLTAELLSELFAEGSESARRFWQQYAQLLPPPNTPFPLLLPKAQREALRKVDSELIQTLESHVLKLKEGWQKQLGAAPPPPMLWTNACVLSRCFHIWSTHSLPVVI